MKLIFCKECHDIFRLINEKRFCKCGKSWGNYTDDINAEIGGLAVPIGFENSSFVKAFKNRPKEGLGSRFDAFVIPEKCPTIKEILF